MPKRIAFCADGTWDDSTKQTNVYKIYKAMLTTADQFKMYDDGVGATTHPLLKVIGGAFGTGIWKKVKDAYAKIAHVYEKDDEVFIFGFSRGAYTARSVAGMIAACGLPTKNFTDDMVDTAFKAYRDKDHRKKILDGLKDCNMYGAKVKMVGVWDTVGSLGIPSAIGAVDPIAYGFLDTGLSPCIENAYHALAIDERRGSFPPTLWTLPATPAAGQNVEQVWFAGVHSDVGGGEPLDSPTDTRALSDVPLAWMMSKAAALGLKFDEDAAKLYPVPIEPTYALDTLHESWKVFCGLPIPRKIPADAAISNSVAIRAQYDQKYRPGNLQFKDGKLAAGYKIVTVAQEPAAATAGA